jgi:alanine racemase
MPAPDSRAWIEVNLRAVRQNVAALRAYLGPAAHLMAVVKADAYGHGMLPVAQAALDAGAHWVGVAAVAEGIALREAGMAAPILLLCPFAPEEAADIAVHALTATLGSATEIDALASVARNFPPQTLAAHLEVDTGIGRAGVLPAHAWALWRRAVEAGIAITGICTHLADADSPDDSFSRAQIEAFLRTRRALEEAGACFAWTHCNNSPGMLRFPEIQANLVRPGLLLYGILPAHPPTDIVLQPALTVKARVATVRSLPTGHPISYGLTHRLTRPSRVATLTIGYGDGFPRRLSNQGSALLRGQKVPILGRVCMDQMVVDVTDLPEVQPGEVAVCIGAQGEARISIEEIARSVETTEHEITTCLTARLPRLYRS